MGTTRMRSDPAAEGLGCSEPCPSASAAAPAGRAEALAQQHVLPWEQCQQCVRIVCQGSVVSWTPVGPLLFPFRLAEPESL